MWYKINKLKSKVKLAILAAILNFSNWSRISSWYPPDIQSGDTKYVKSSEKTTYQSMSTAVWLPDYQGYWVLSDVYLLNQPWCD